jgi:hypothetical protein
MIRSRVFEPDPDNSQEDRQLLDHQKVLPKLLIVGDECGVKEQEGSEVTSSA